MKLEFTRQFLADYAKLPEHIQAQTDLALDRCGSIRVIPVCV